MGYFSEYLDKKLDFPALTAERKKRLADISRLRGNRDVLVIASDLSKANAPISIIYDDLLPVNDQLSNLKGSAVDLVLETPGGSGEVAEDIVKLLHGKYQDVGVIVPGYAKSAGTIITMAGDEILMEPASALGPIDAQLSWQGKVFSADALLEGMEKIKKEVAATGVLNKAYIPVLQGISPGELQSAENALKFAGSLVTDWLVKYKFKNWVTHAKSGTPVTEEEKKTLAKEIADKLSNHKQWLTHGRSIKIDDLQQMGLRVTDYSLQPDLAEAIRRYHTLLRMTFQTNMYKVFETVSSQIYRFMGSPVQGGPDPTKVEVAEIAIKCIACGEVANVQVNMGTKKPIKPGNTPFPSDNNFKCQKCSTQQDLSDLRRQLEAQTKKRVVT
jgi:ClpP class serine protease